MIRVHRSRTRPVYRRIGAGIVGTVTAFAAVLASAGYAPSQAQETLYAEIQPGVGVSAELGGAGGFLELVNYSVYFLSDSSTLSTGVITGPNAETTMTVFRTAEGDANAVGNVERCQLADGMPVCDPLELPAEFRIGEDNEGRGVVLMITIPQQRIEEDNEFFRLNVGQGRYRLSTVAADGSLADPRDSPPIVNAILPALVDLEQQYLEQRPFFHVEATPLIRQQPAGEGGFDDLGLSLSGGMFRVRGGGNTRLELTWDGEVATNDSAAFNHLTLEAGVARNLWPGDWLPITLTVQGQSDQGFDAFDISANASLAFVLPFNVNLQTGAYRPALAPRLRVLAAYGSALDREAADLEGGFGRVGYEVQWRVPVGDVNLVRFRHANLWNDPAGADGSWHALWDVQAEVTLRGMTYFVGYQKGEAAPLFAPIETTRMGFSFAISDPTTSGR